MRRKEGKEYDTVLQKYIDNRSFVKIFRTIFEKEENLFGFIIGMSEQFLFIQLSGEFNLDGFAIIRKDDFDSIRHSSYERTQRKILKAEGLLESGIGFDQFIPLTSWKDIFTTLKKNDIHAIIENTKDDYLDFWIGPIVRATEKTVSIHNYDPDGRLNEKPTSIKLDTISIVKFGDRYSTIFRKYLKPAKTSS